jgi:hypothetical protein
VASIKEAVGRFEVKRHLVNPADCHLNAQRFAPDRFRREFSASVDQVIEMHR